MFSTNDAQICCFQEEIIKPSSLITLLPVDIALLQFIDRARAEITDIIKGIDNRLLVVIGPCSIHDVEAALEYAERLKKAAAFYQDELLIIMRVYFEKPRTTVGWKGLINDPHLNGSFDISYGLKLARKLLININRLGLPAGTEFLDTLVPHYLSELIAWCAVGARTVESQLHRALASSLFFPVGFKNNTDGNMTVAIDGITAASHPHRFLSINKQGAPAITHTEGNPNCHLILRGSNQSPNYEASHVHRAVRLLELAGFKKRLLIDCSHGNSMKDYRRQKLVVQDICAQLAQGSSFIAGIMLESNLIAGKQLFDSSQHLTYGQSITDGCLGWDMSLHQLDKLALAARNRNIMLRQLL